MSNIKEIFEKEGYQFINSLYKHFNREADNFSVDFYHNLLETGVSNKYDILIGVTRVKDNQPPTITMSCLGRKGRFGNQLFQYAFIKIYTKNLNVLVQTPPWVGQYLFGFNDPSISRKLPQVRQITHRLSEDPIPNSKFVYKNVDFAGYFQYHTKFYAPYKDYFQYLFKPIDVVERLMLSAMKLLYSKGNTLVGLHLRRGDYGTRPDWDFAFIPPNEWYKEWLNTFWNDLDSPILFIASDEPEKVLPEFQEYNPVSVKDLGITLVEANFYPDFYILSNCDIVAISNSTFSFAACMLNNRGKQFVRPNQEYGKLVSFDPWHSEPLLRSKDSGLDLRNWTKPLL